MTIPVGREARNAYRAETERGQAMTFPSLKLVHGFRGLVKLGETTVAWGSLCPTETAARRWAIAEAKRRRDYRRQHGESIEDVARRKDVAKKAERRRRRRLEETSLEMYELLQAMVSDLELGENLPEQAGGRIAKARALLSFVDDEQAVRRSSAMNGAVPVGAPRFL